jgi:hypothetical protein
MLPREELREKSTMSTTVVDQPSENATPQNMRPSAEQHASAKLSVDKFADARREKKKEKRARHRAKLRRSHTDG